MSTAQADWIHLSKIGFPCIVGLYEDEQRTPQRLELELWMGLDLSPAAGGDLTYSVHYVAALDQVQFIAQEGRWRLLESLAMAIARHLLRPPALDEGRAGLDRVRVRVGKPAYLKGRALPAVEIEREQSFLGVDSPQPATRGLSVHPLQITRQSGACHLDLGASAAFVVPDSMSAFVLAGMLSKPDGASLARGTVAKSGETVQNSDTGPARLLVVGRPFLASDAAALSGR